MHPSRIAGDVEAPPHPRDGGPVCAVGALLKRARQALLQDPGEASALALRAAALARGLGDVGGRFEALALASAARLSMSDFAGADPLIAEVGELASGSGQLARHRTLLAIRTQRLGDLHAALVLINEALRCLAGTPESRTRSAAMTHNAAGNLLSQFADFPGAVEQFHLALEVVDEADDHVLGVVANNIGRAHRELREFDAAERVLRDALARSTGADGSVLRAVLLATLGEVLTDDGRPAAALEPLTEALQISEARGFSRARGAAHHCLGRAQRALGEPDLAHTHFLAAQGCREANEERLDLAETQVELAVLLLERHRSA